MSDEVSEAADHPARHAAPDVPAVAEEAPARRFATGFTSLRDVMSFLAGVVIIGHEVFFSHRVEVSILTVGVALCGLPVVFGADEKKKKP